jgi:hypothetical protein
MENNGGGGGEATPALSEIEYWNVLKQRILLRKLESGD